MSKEKHLRKQAQQRERWRKACTMGRMRYIMIYGFLTRSVPVFLMLIGVLLYIQPLSITPFAIQYVFAAFLASCFVGYVGASGSWSALEQRFGYDDQEHGE